MTSRQARIAVTGPKRLGLVGVAGLAAALALNACSSSTNAGPAASNAAATSSIPTDQTSFVAQEAAAKAIGWTAKEISYDGTVADLNAKFEQAISEKPTVITLRRAMDRR